MKRQRAFVVAIGLALAAGAYLWTRGEQAGLPGGRTLPAASTPGRGEELPRIDLARLSGQRGAPELGRRNIFAYGQLQPREGTAPPPPPRPTVVAAPPPPPATVATLPTVPPLNVKYIGSVEAKGLRVAVLITDRKEILTGQAGEVVANRFRIVKIGYESLDIQDVGSDRVRRIPFKGN